MPSGFDVIVLGVGGFGSGTLYHLARRGARVLGIEQFGVAHDRGSSHGQTRIIRQAYFEHPDYVPLLRRAYDLWHALEQETGRTLFHQVGLFLAGAPDAEAIHGTQLAAQTHQLPLERLDALQARNRFPGYRFPEDWAVLFERQAGYLAVEACVQAHVDAALAHGAQLLTGETVRGIEPTNDGVRVRTDRETYDAGRLVVTAGPWAARLLAEVGTTAGWSDCLRVVRKPVFWFPAGAEFDVAQGNSTFFFETAAGQFYGFPRLDGRSIKVAEHTQGDAVDDPLAVDRTQHPADLERVERFLNEHLPTVGRPPLQHSVCMYTRTPDSHFLIDRHPDCPAILLGAGFSGHGFKFTTVLGQALAELALDGATTLPIDFLSLGRLSTSSSW